MTMRTLSHQVTLLKEAYGDRAHEMAVKALKALPDNARKAKYFWTDVEKILRPKEVIPVVKKPTRFETAKAVLSQSGITFKVDVSNRIIVVEELRDAV